MMKSIVHSLDATNTKMIAAISRIHCLMSLIVLSFHCVLDKSLDELAHLIVYYVDMMAKESVPVL